MQTNSFATGLRRMKEIGTKPATLRHVLLLISNIHEHAWDQSNFTKCMRGSLQICSSKCMRGS